MTIPDRSSDDAEAGFTYALDRGMARRQFRMSLGVIVVLGMAIATAALTVKPAPAGNEGYAAFQPSMTMHAERSLAPPDRS